MALFPDSGVPASDAKNSLPDVNTAGCQELWYSTSRCQPRFDPASANAMLAEDMNLIMKGELQYDCLRLDHIERAVRYITQRGLPNQGYAYGGPADYTLSLDPPLTRYNDGLLVLIYPVMKNNGPVTLNVNGLGAVSVRRNDFQHLQMYDLDYNPTLLAYYAGYFWYVGLARSQVPLIMTSSLDLWVRTDGNDATGDGTINDPAKAFRTINGAYAKVGTKYAASPLYGFHIRLGIPGTYEACGFPGGSNQVWIHGDQSNVAGYRIKGTPAAGSNTWTVLVSGTPVWLIGVTLLMDQARVSTAQHYTIGSFTGATVNLEDCRIEVLTSNVGALALFASAGARITQVGRLDIVGNGQQISDMMFIDTNSSYFPMWNSANGGVNASPVLSVTNLNVTSSFLTASAVSTMRFQTPMILYSSGCIGRQYWVTGNSVVQMDGNIPPGDVTGLFSNGGQYIP